MDLAELTRRTSSFSEMHERLFEHEKRIRDLIDPPALRWLRESERHMRLAAVGLYSQHRRAEEVQAERIGGLLAPMGLFAQTQALEQTRAASFYGLASPVDEITRRLAVLDNVGAVYRRINDTAIDRIQEMLRASTTAATALVAMPDIGAVVREMQERTSVILGLAAKDYARVAGGFDSFVTDVGLAATHTFTDIPEREFFVSADLLSGLTGRGLSREEIGEEPRIVRKRIDLYVYETLDEALTDFAPTFLSALEGARQIAVSTSPEKIRYACVSLRTVSIGVLELLAPTEEIKKWSTRPRDFFNGRPRTLTRLRFVAQRIDSPALARFMDADSRAICELIDVLHAGTHEFGLDLNRRQLRYVFRRVESFLCALLETTMS